VIMQRERELLVLYGRRLVESGLTKGTTGNLSIFDRNKGQMAITPSGIDYFEIHPEDIVIMDLDGKVVDGNRTPSSEYEMHRIFYQNRIEVNAVVHTHSTYCTTIASLNWAIPAVHYLVGFAGNDVKCATYATYGTKELAKNALNAMRGCNAALLANHGLLTVGSSLQMAFNVAEQIEFCAEIYYRAKCIGEPTILPDAEMELMKDKFKTYGQRPRA
jgi:L-fuculose-phosphate aldolase